MFKRLLSLPKNTYFDLFAILVVALYPIVFINLQNYDHADLCDFLVILSLFLGFASIIFLFVWILLKDITTTSLITVIILLFSSYFKLIDDVIIYILPMFFYWHSLMIVFTFIILLGIFIIKKISKENIHKINKIFLLVFSLLIAFNLFVSIPQISNSTKTNFLTLKNIERDKTKSEDSNIYYLIFDEFGGYDNVERYCNYDNSLFYNSLQSLGFNVSKHSRNLTIYTDVEIPNLLNLELINTVDMPHNLRVQSLKSPFLFSLVKEKNYQLNVVVDKIFQNQIPIEILNKDYEYKSSLSYSYEETINFLILKNTIIYPLINKTFYKRNIEITNMFNYVVNSPNLQSKQLFTFGYFTFPHFPWVVDELGRNVDPRNHENWTNSKYYCDQMKYTSKKIIEISNAIIEVDPNSIIIIQSDHGFRQPTHLNMLFGEKNNLQEENIYETNILNAVYFKGEEMQIESLSGLDTLIKVFNKLFYLDLPYVGLGH